MTLKEQIQADLITSMKAKDEVRTGTLRMVKAAIMKYEVSGENMEATDEVIMDLVKKEVKQRNDAAEGFQQGGNTAMAEKELAEAALLKAYLPEQMSEEQVIEVVKKVLADAGITTKAEMGKAMAAVMPAVKGKADGGMVNRVVASLLQ